ncbi:hypothetical protein [Natronosalvus rutilus]|uniref:Uncharacterized protein n=1 Tax=Natronosalvus rutilus TaxID=2953753 RepID=A0A9E7SVH4_9EURY|nr:hypothetical protein [Natronosalvus rutilus]UTF52288.1 hypothetical protein NGM29_10845 [Natronosalvus rutilus]
MATVTEKIDLENDLVQMLVTEAVKAGMESPLRDPILNAVEESTGESLKATSEADTSGTEEKSRLTRVLQGGTVFIVLFAVLYITLRRVTSDESDT